MHRQRHVVRRSDGAWEVRERVDSPALSCHANRRQAVGRAQEILRISGGGDLMVHDQDGYVRGRATIPSGYDPGTAPPPEARPVGDTESRPAPVFAGR
jgi:hypothetical protein